MLTVVFLHIDTNMAHWLTPFTLHIDVNLRSKFFAAVVKCLHVLFVWRLADTLLLE